MNEIVIKSENVWNEGGNILNDLNRGRAALQAEGFVYKEPTMVVPEHIYSFLEETGNYPQDEEVTHLGVLLYNSLVESVISIKSKENTVYLWVNKYEIWPEISEVSEIDYVTGCVIITDIVTQSRNKDL